MHLTRATLAIALAASATALPVNDKPNLPVEESRTPMMPGGAVADSADKTPRSLSSHFGFAQSKSGMPAIPTEQQSKQQPDKAPRSDSHFHFGDSEGKPRMPDNSMNFEQPTKEPPSEPHFNLAQDKPGFNPTNEGSHSGGSWEGGITDRVEGPHNDKAPRSHQALAQSKPGFIGTGMYATPEGIVPTMQKREWSREGRIPTEQWTNPSWKGQNGDWPTFNGDFSGRKDGYDAPIVQRSKGDSRDGYATDMAMLWGTENSGRKDGYDAPAAGRWTSAEGYEWGLENAARKDGKGGLVVTLAGGRKDGYDAPIVQRSSGMKGDAPWTGGQAAFPIPPWVNPPTLEAGHGQESSPLGALEAEKKGEWRVNGMWSRPGWTGSANDASMKPGAKMDLEIEPRDVVRGAGMDAVQGEYPAAPLYRERKGSNPLNSLIVGGDEGNCPTCSME
jgi:hypothetical protein